MVGYRSESMDGSRVLSMAKTRLEYNLAILRHLEEYVKACPDQRFGQILRNAGTIVETTVQPTVDGFHVITWRDGFNEESNETLERMKNAL